MYRRYIFRRPIPSNYNSTLSKYKGRCPRSGPLSSFQGSLSSPQVPGIHVDAVIASELDHDNLNIGLESDPTPPLRDGNCIPTQMRRVGIQDPGSRAIHGEREGGREKVLGCDSPTTLNEFIKFETHCRFRIPPAPAPAVVAYDAAVPVCASPLWLASELGGLDGILWTKRTKTPGQPHPGISVDIRAQVVGGRGIAHPLSQPRGWCRWKAGPGW